MKIAQFDSDLKDWFQSPAPPPYVSFTMAATFAAIALYLYIERVKGLRREYGDEFRGPLMICGLISAYMDNHDHPQLATLKLTTKALFFLGIHQQNFHMGFVVTWCMLIFESALDVLRVVLGYITIGSIENLTSVSVKAGGGSQQAVTELEPSNVYEDLGRPQSIAVMVFLVQSMLIGLVMDDTHDTTERPCFDDTTEACMMLESVGSYFLFLMGTFMICVFYIGPRNAYGQKEQNPIFWVKLFLMSKEHAATITWTDPATDESCSIPLIKNDPQIATRFLMSFIINGFGFHVLLFLLPLQVAGQPTIADVVLQAIGMIYLAELDDSEECQMSLASRVDKKLGNSSENGASIIRPTRRRTYNGGGFESAKQQIIDEAMAEVRAKLEALHGEVGPDDDSIAYYSQQTEEESPKIVSITNALYAVALARNRFDLPQADDVPTEFSPLNT